MATRGALLLTTTLVLSLGLAGSVAAQRKKNRPPGRERQYSAATDWAPSSVHLIVGVAWIGQAHGSMHMGGHERNWPGGAEHPGARARQVVRSFEGFYSAPFLFTLNATGCRAMP